MNKFIITISKVMIYVVISIYVVIGVLLIVDDAIIHLSFIDMVLNILALLLITMFSIIPFMLTYTLAVNTQVNVSNSLEESKRRREIEESKRRREIYNKKTHLSNKELD